jgi:hypothetical protein
MSLKHGRIDDPYPTTQIFSKEELLELRPSDIKAYLNWKAYGDPYPGDDDEPLDGRSGSLSRYKCDISHYMPNNGVAWMVGRGGNPTRHSSVSGVIKTVHALETKGKGVKPNDKRAYSDPESSQTSVLGSVCHEEPNKSMIGPT